MKRLCIYPKDIQIITGRSDRYGRSLIQKMKEHFHKEAHQMITIQEFFNTWVYKKKPLQAKFTKPYAESKNLRTAFNTLF